MSKRCARCDSFNPRRSMKASGEWVKHLEMEHDYSHAGTVVLPLCTDCYKDARDLPDDVTENVETFLSELDTTRLVDEVAG